MGREERDMKIEMLERVKQMVMDGKVEAFAISCIDGEGAPMNACAIPNGKMVEVIGSTTILLNMLCEKVGNDLLDEEDLSEEVN